MRSVNERSEPTLPSLDRLAAQPRPDMPVRAKDFDFLFLPGRGNSGISHWQTHWLGALPNSSRLLQGDWETPDPIDWICRLVGNLGHMGNDEQLGGWIDGLLLLGRLLGKAGL